MFTIIGIILIAIISFICVAPIAMPIAACTMDGKPNKAQYFWGKSPSGAGAGYLDSAS